MLASFPLLFTCLASLVTSLRWDPDQVPWNLNEVSDADHPLDYDGIWRDHEFHPSPSTWRFPFYTIMVDRFIDGDPTNNEANGTSFEHQWLSTQWRFGGDPKGLMNHLDYLQGMGIKGIYMAGSPFLNQPWGGDGYGPLDFTLLDHHHGTIQDWRNLIEEIHSRDMYVILDNVLATMGNLLAFEGHVNTTTPFSWNEYDALWKTDRQYLDFTVSNDWNETCVFPRMWDEHGHPVGEDVLEHQRNGCKANDFDAFGDMKGVGAVPTYEEQLSKFASVQDRLRAWPGSEVLEKLKQFSCIQIKMLDIDGFRMDKGVQTPLDSLADWSRHQKQCAHRLGKQNFMIVGEEVSEIPYAALYNGRGKQPEQQFDNFTAALLATNETDPDSYVRPADLTALDAAAFHYPTYGALTRFLGLDGPIGLEGVDWVDHWSRLVATDDMVNSQTGVFDPRHMFGTTNQDVFRWPSLANGTHRQMLGSFITTLALPGIPMLHWGEEQEFQVLENLANDYVFGRQPMGSSSAWQLHGCYNLGAELYVDLPFDSARYACHDDKVSLNHLDPSHALRNIYKRMFEMRRQFPTLNDGFRLSELSRQTHDILLPGSLGMPSPNGLWSVYRGRVEGVQDFSEGQGNQGVWLLYSNTNHTVEYQFDCQSSNTSESLISAFARGTTVKNLFYPYEEVDLESSTAMLGIEGETDNNGCLSNLTMPAWGYKAYVPKARFVTPDPTITKVIPRHDDRIISTVAADGQEDVTIEIHFSREMDCDSVVGSITINSTTPNGQTARLDNSSVTCLTTNAGDTADHYVSQVRTEWIISARLTNVANGIHSFTVNNATSANGTGSTGSRDTFMFRIGQPDNPIVFSGANYTTDLLHKNDSTGDLYVSHKAAGADLWRYSLNWGSSWSNWIEYTGGSDTLEDQPWSGTKNQAWKGEHVILNYWSEKSGSSDHVQHGDLSKDNLQKRWPSMHVESIWNQWGYDAGLDNSMKHSKDGWTFKLSSEWPTKFVFNVWGMNPDGFPDKTMLLGDVDIDHVLDLLAPDSLASNIINITEPPGMPHTAWEIHADDSNWSWSLRPAGSATRQIVIFILLAAVPIASAALAMFAFYRSFYQVKHNKMGLTDTAGWLSIFRSGEAPTQKPSRSFIPMSRRNSSSSISSHDTSAADSRRTVLIATMEYEIEDWDIKIKIGGLGVMANLMGKNLGHQNLIWVVPCVGGIEYPVDQPGEPMVVTVFGKEYRVGVQYHSVRNITYVLLDAPVFRKQTKAEPYPARMDDLESAIYYAAWNSCIAETIKRFPQIDLYHINDYHGALAPLYLLPRVIPCCLSLHNAEFQGLWPLRNPQEMDEISKVFNLDKKYIQDYVQFGEVFNLLHAGASYLRIHQKGFGAVGVSKKYGKRSFARYPIFWGLHAIGALPNPDPSDTAAWSKDDLINSSKVEIDQSYEANRGALRMQAQEWAGLKVDPNAELFVFVGRWSMQKGVDAIADVFPSILEKYKNTQLICIGPVIDLYGKFAALKLSKLMEKYPDRVYSKPEFTQLPPFIFSGAEFALIPSRDEPFGLVAVEFGRKGALGVGARVGGLGQMPGFWFTIESTATKHLLSQFKSAIKAALASNQQTRAEMRARSAVQRFPVVQWVADLEKLQNTAINKHRKVTGKKEIYLDTAASANNSAATTAANTPFGSLTNSPIASPSASRAGSRAPSPSRQEEAPAQSYGRHFGPGHDERGTRLPRSQSFTQIFNFGSRGPSRQSSVTSLNSDYNAMSEQSDAINAHVTRRLGEAGQGHGQETSQANDRGRSNPMYRTSGGSYFTKARPPHPLKVFPSLPATPLSERIAEEDPAAQEEEPVLLRLPHASMLSLEEVTGKRQNSARQEKTFKLENVDPSFTDKTNFYYNKFDKMLEKLEPSNSETKLCIEEYLTKSEKEWFNRFHQAKLGMSRPVTPDSEAATAVEESSDPEDLEKRNFQQLLGEEYKPPAGLRKILQYKIGDWPVYAFLLALGQIIAANSYQITLITGKVGQTARDLYIIASIYLVSTILWWFLSRKLRSIYVLSLPFFFYGSAFFLLGFAPFCKSADATGWVQNVATGCYALASASGYLFFALNFGSEGGTAVKTWVFRACTVQGTQQIYVSALWYWGSTVSTLTTSGVTVSQRILSVPKLTAITSVVAVFLWLVGLVLFFGLPNYYRANPGVVPSFYTAAIRRKIILWFLVVVVIQNYFLSTNYGRNWQFLWSSTQAPTWAIVCLLLLFFIFVWAGMLLFLSRLTLEHSWIFPLFAIGLGAPRWAQMLWGVSGIGVYLPWTGSAIASALVSRSLWLWLGILDALQGVGFGMILLQTLTRIHIAFTLCATQVLGSIATMVARATAPNATGPDDVFPNLASSLEGLGTWEFWVALILQLCCCVGFFVFFRKEQLFKP